MNLTYAGVKQNTNASILLIFPTKLLFHSDGITIRYMLIIVVSAIYYSFCNLTKVAKQMPRLGL